MPLWTKVIASLILLTYFENIEIDSIGFPSFCQLIKRCSLFGISINLMVFVEMENVVLLPILHSIVLADTVRIAVLFGYFTSKGMDSSMNSNYEFDLRSIFISL